jgi:adhesin transport system membrane fusion protein
MLNISKYPIRENIDLKKFKSVKYILERKEATFFNRFLFAFAILGLVMLFLPWTQNISSRGLVTTLQLNKRPQTIQSQIPGRIEEWFVREGDFVKKGDTILRISEIKSDYFDTQLAERTNDQIVAKSGSEEAYRKKTKALKRQILALKKEQNLKLQQARNKVLQAFLKVKSDSIDLETAKLNTRIAQRQFDRISLLKNEGLKAVKDVEAIKIKLQETQAKAISQQNKLLSSKNDIINAQVEISRITMSYTDKISKTESDLYSAQSNTLNTKAQVSKLQSTFANYTKRNSLLYITAPQNGYINKAIVGGIGASFKEGAPLVGIMPNVYDLAVETFVKPIDLPLIHIGEKVRVQFDGWPAIVFNGWPNVSYGTYGAKVIAIENYISKNGKYRVLLAPDEKDHPWPDIIRVGSGAQTIALLKDVPIWFELWRQLNSFPPNYYQPETTSQK